MTGHPPERSESDVIAADVAVLHQMGYAQELSRKMKLFSNFAVAFSVICILAGGITSLQLAFCAGGGFAVCVGWLVGGLFALIVACSMAQIASAYPTAGGLYHWSTILGGRGWGWATAWINLLGYIIGVGSVNVGAYLLFTQLILTNLFGIDVSHWGFWQQLVGMIIITLSQILLNHYSLRLTRLLTDFSGYLILGVAIFLVAIMLIAAPGFHFGRLVQFTNYTGAAGGGVYPNQLHSPLLIFLLALLLPLYTITGYDASAHTSEETINARWNVPKGIIFSVIVSTAFGWIMVCSFVLAMPDPAAAAKNGGNIFFALLSGLAVPGWTRAVLYIGIVIANYLCGLAGIIAYSRLMYAFARDGGLPFSHYLRRIHPRYRTPVHAIWAGGILATLATLYSPAFNALATGAAMFLYVAYAMPTFAGLLAEGKHWSEFGPFRLGMLSKPFAIITSVGAVVIIYIGIQPPNNILISYVVALVILLALGWFLLERKRFPGPPIGDQVAKRQAIIRAEEMELNALGRSMAPDEAD
jgi:amino acid transporter